MDQIVIFVLGVIAGILLDRVALWQLAIQLGRQCSGRRR